MWPSDTASKPGWFQHCIYSIEEWSVSSAPAFHLLTQEGGRVPHIWTNMKFELSTMQLQMVQSIWGLLAEEFNNNYIQKKIPRGLIWILIIDMLLKMTLSMKKYDEPKIFLLWMLKVRLQFSTFFVCNFNKTLGVVSFWAGIFTYPSKFLFKSGQ